MKNVTFFFSLSYYFNFQNVTEFDWKISQVTHITHRIPLHLLNTKCCTVQCCQPDKDLFFFSDSRFIRYLVHSYDTWNRMPCCKLWIICEVNVQNEHFEPTALFIFRHLQHYIFYASHNLEDTKYQLNTQECHLREIYRVVNTVRFIISLFNFEYPQY